MIHKSYAINLSCTTYRQLHWRDFSMPATAYCSQNLEENPLEPYKFHDIPEFYNFLVSFISLAGFSPPWSRKGYNPEQTTTGHCIITTHSRFPSTPSHGQKASHFVFQTDPVTANSLDFWVSWSLSNTFSYYSGEVCNNAKIPQVSKSSAIYAVVHWWQ